MDDLKFDSRKAACEDVPATPPLSENQQELGKILKSLKQDPTLMGCISLGTDGVLRSLTADRNVVDAVALNPGLVKAMLDRLPFDQGIEDKYRGVDGTSVPRKEWFSPNKNLLPEPMSEETKEETRKLIEANKELLEKRALGPPKCCGPIVRSNYNLDIKSVEKQE